MAKKAEKEEVNLEEPAVVMPQGGPPEKPDTGRTETRLFQTDSHTREWLTRDQAKAKGFHWKDKK